MRFTIIWERKAAEGLRHLKARDGDAVRPLTQAINALAVDPEPPTSNKLGGTNMRRLRVGRYRATYSIDGSRVAIKVLLVGSTPA
ncbi:type II toxin-antitoxin system RelE/ParE family toxin [Streptomyces sp. NBC_01481]|uniref:type II toxin-antitoxin system RelE family toxin n=1 Tax=Streptomyces sp. NBC_01481 TaxID=2975869 RepID=UPI00225B8A04|nr:type II toxin-antitoxin system RelE/ParE family toxin [Streptomyces sp. NBC_01481]MCX4584552.1 type II toxin-antitoxin system RelE/ParE family toxin [Streptomyces sp. NBC_01481]